MERSPAPRQGGYIIDFWGPGYDGAERMGLLPRLNERGYFVQEVRLVDAEGKRVGEFSADRRFAGAGWETPQILEAMMRAEDIYFDNVSQIRIPAWTRGRVALLGDAAAYPSLLAGEGSSLAMAEAYVLAGELARAEGDHGAAFVRYEQVMRPFIARKQRAAAGLAASFAPRDALLHNASQPDHARVCNSWRCRPLHRRQPEE